MTMISNRRQVHSAFDDMDTPARPEVRGKFIYKDEEKMWVRGVTYGTFKPDASGNEFHNPGLVERDFAHMAENGINTVRTYTPPPKWVLDAANRHDLYVMVGLPWEQHVTFLDRKDTARDIKNRVREMIRELSGHPSIFCYVIGNEIPASIVRWHGRKKIERFIKSLYYIAKAEDPDGLVTYVNFPTTEYLQLPFLDFQCFNVYLEQQDRLASYLRRLQNIAGEMPLVLGEIGLDSRRNGEEKQAEALDRQIRTAFQIGCAGTFVYAWTDEWYRGGYDIEDWDFGLTRRDRSPKKALPTVRNTYAQAPFPHNLRWPRISVVVCSYNGERFIRDCFEALSRLDYPDFEVIVVNDGSTDKTAEIALEYPFRLISTENTGLSNARNTGLAASTGEIVAYIDDDAYPDRDWLKYLAATFLEHDCAGVGGPNIAPPNDGRTADCMANAPGGPLHVLISDLEAEHIPGCNMAFRRDCLETVGGFDPQFRVAGDDVDLCWRIHQRGWWLAFSTGAMVWHHRRNSVRTYLKQQVGYGKAEALLERKWPEKYNSTGHMTWAGRIYGKGLTKCVGWKKWRVYYGVNGSAPFQSLYGHCPTFLQALPLMPEWYLVNAALAFFTVLGFFWKPLLIAIPLLAIAVCLPLINVFISMSKSALPDRSWSKFDCLKSKILIGIFHIAHPMARLFGRICHGLSPWRRRGPSCGIFPRRKKYEIWSESWQSPSDWIRSVKTGIAKLGAIVKSGGDFDPWDLETRGGLLGAARSKMAIEEHGGGNQLVRFQTWSILSPIAFILISLFGLLSLLSILDHNWTFGALFFILVVGATLHAMRDCAIATAVFCQVLLAHNKQNISNHAPENESVFSNRNEENFI